MIEIDIYTITGQSPYNIYVCDDDTYSGCVWVGNTSTVPYKFLLPYPYNKSCNVFVKIIDNNNCVMTETLNRCI